MDRIREEYLKNIELYKDHPEVSRYILGNKECIICFKEAISTPAQFVKENTPKINTEKKKNYTADLKYLIERLGVCVFEKTRDVEVSSSNVEITDPILTYLRFIECADLGPSKTAMRRFDLDVFSKVFGLDVVDQNIQKFIEKLENDPMMYEKKDKSTFLSILLLAHSFCNNGKMETKKLLNKISENSFLLNNKIKLRIGFQGEPSIDKLVLQIRENTTDISEALFMNSIYLNIARNRELFPFFHRRLVDTISILEDQLTFSYLKYVFTHNTVLFTCIENSQLVKLILSFYQNMNKLDFTIEVCSGLIKKVEDGSVNRIISDEMIRLCKNAKKHIKLSKHTEFRSLNTFNEILDFISSNKDSFDCMNIVFNDLKDISECALDHKVRIEILSVLMYFFRNMKNEFVSRFFNTLILIFIRLFSVISEVDHELIEFNKLYWDDLSDILLTSHRISVENEEKKKKKDIKESQPYKQALRLAELIYKIEEKARKQGISEFKTIKEKGFRIDE